MKPKDSFFDLKGNIMDEPLSNLQANYLRLCYPRLFLLTNMHFFRVKN
jgi:hypothetical protein